MPSWDDRWDDDFLHSGAGRYQTVIDRAVREDMQAGVQAPDGWRRPHEKVCEVCWYVLVFGACVKGCASLSERDQPGAGKARSGVASSATTPTRASSELVQGAGGNAPARSESDEVAA